MFSKTFMICWQNSYRGDILCHSTSQFFRGEGGAKGIFEKKKQIVFWWSNARRAGMVVQNVSIECKEFVLESQLVELWAISFIVDIQVWRKLPAEDNTSPISSNRLQNLLRVRMDFSDNNNFLSVDPGLFVSTLA